ncbi:MAG: restriction endonuclease [Deltaproteobacteria bacterium]|jgi:restriction system protein|nr:restriction endonuclease [Deltaproteobacteria bacterium]
MSKKTLKVRTPQFPLYSEVRHLLQIFEGVSQAAIKAMFKSIEEQTGTPRQPVDWSTPESWIAKRLTGDAAVLAERIWQESNKEVNPRHVYGSYLFINNNGLLSDNVFGVYQTTPRGQAFLANDPKLLAEIDDQEGLPHLLRILAGKTSARRRDILPEWSDFLREHSHFGTQATIRDTLRRRLNNLVERSYVSREGVTYLITKKGLDYAEQFTQTDLDQKRDVVRAIKDFNQEQMHKLNSLLAFMQQRDFEFLVQELLEALGYEDIKITRESGSKGVEVTASIQFGINTVPEVIHVKRYQTSTGRPALDQLRKAAASRECFRTTLITLGRFTKECKEAAITPDSIQVKLIDGQHLLMLLSENSIGITRQPVTLYHIDEEYFSSSKDTSSASEN